MLEECPQLVFGDKNVPTILNQFVKGSGISCFRSRKYKCGSGGPFSGDILDYRDHRDRKIEGTEGYGNTEGLERYGKGLKERICNVFPNCLQVLHNPSRAFRVKVILYREFRAMSASMFPCPPGQSIWALGTGCSCLRDIRSGIIRL